MTETEKLAAIEEIRQLRAKYWRGVDSHDAELVRSILAEDCLLDYTGCMTDPTTGVDHMPVMNLVLRGRDSWQTDNLEGPRIVTVHQGHQYEIEITSETTARGIWYFTDRFFLPEGGPFTRLVGYGRYHETYEKAADGWKLKTTRIERIWVESN
ncbi:MAG: nuclear transport factor 2 family protein [Novosphingobium sp.]|nr:nuclear transport factor 2 family protein [Novosphingobium sp.]